MSAAVIAGSFADYRLVKSRSVLQVIVEIPIEQQGAAFAALGYPQPGTEIAVAVARLNPASGVVPERPAVDDAPSIRPPDDGASHSSRPKSPAERAVIRAALLPKDERFRAWAMQKLNPRLIGQQLDEESCADFIREECCGGRSRALIAEVPEYMDRFLTMELEFRMDVGEVARPR